MPGNNSTQPVLGTFCELCPGLGPGDRVKSAGPPDLRECLVPILELDAKPAAFELAQEDLTQIWFDRRSDPQASSEGLCGLHRSNQRGDVQTGDLSQCKALSGQFGLPMTELGEDRVAVAIDERKRLVELSRDRLPMPDEQNPGAALRRNQ